MARATHERNMTNVSWTGSSDDWNNASNWTPEQVPTANDSASINGDSAVTVTINGSESETVGSFLLNDEAATVDVSGTLDVAGTLTLRTGTLELDGTLENATVVNDGGTFDAGFGLLKGDTWQGNLEIGGESTVVVQGGLTAQGAGGAGPGSITIDGADANLQFNDTETFDNATITLGSANGLDEMDANGTLTLGAGVTVQTAATIEADTLGGQGLLVNEGTILDDTAGQFFIEPSDFTNAGTITVSNGAEMTIEPAFGLFGTLDNAGNITVANASTLAIESGTFINTGSIEINGGSLDIIAANWITPAAGSDGVFALGGGATVTFGEAVGESQQIDFLDGTGTLDLASPGAFLGTILGFQAGDTIDLAGLAGDTSSFNDGTLTFTDAGTIDANIAFAGNVTASELILSQDGAGGVTVTEEGVPCYCPGTLLLTDRGEVAVETLAVGDRVVTVSGALEPIRWIGRRSYAGRFLLGKRDILPVVIRRGALGENVPRRDLRISPMHAMYLDGVLVAARDLVNGVSIVQETNVRQVDYIHIELAAHDVIWAEGAASETYLDDDNRGMFHNAHEYLETTPKRGLALYCAPRVADGFVLEEIRQRIAERADGHQQAA
jgi:Hint domain